MTADVLRCERCGLLTTAAEAELRRFAAGSCGRIVPLVPSGDSISDRQREINGGVSPRPMICGGLLKPRFARVIRTRSDIP